MTEITLTINGEERTLEASASVTLLDALREHLHMTGTKRGCDAGACGACTVVVDGEAILSCMTPLIRCRGREVLTVEGLARNGKLHPLQESAIEHGAVQCGYCTPGWLMSAKVLLDRNPTPTEDDVRHAIAGNFCRCTGYQKIVESILATSELPIATE